MTSHAIKLPSSKTSTTAIAAPAPLDEPPSVKAEESPSPAGTIPGERGAKGGDAGDGGGGATTIGTVTDLWTTGVDTAVALMPSDEESDSSSELTLDALLETASTVAELLPSPFWSGMVIVTMILTEPACTVRDRRQTGSKQPSRVFMAMATSAVRATS